MPLAFEAGEVYEVELGSHKLPFRHLTARQARRWRQQLDEYLNDTGKADPEKAEAAAAMCQPMFAGDGELMDLLSESLLVVLPVAVESCRRLKEQELGESCWRRIFASVSAAEPVQTDVETRQANPSP